MSLCLWALRRAYLSLGGNRLVPRCKNQGLMKIAYLFQSSGIEFDHPAAAQLHMLYTVASLRGLGHQVALVANQRGRNVLFADKFDALLPDPPDAHARLGVSGTRPFKLVESGLRRLQTELKLPHLGLFESLRIYEASLLNLADYDVIHERYNLMSIGGALASKRLRVPYILEVNADLLEQRRFKGRPERGLRKRFGEWATRMCFKNADAILCISSGMRSHLARRWNLDPEKLFIMPCAADVDVFQPRGDENHIRQDLGLTDEPILMWVGRFYPWHDLGVLLRGFRWVIERAPSARLILLGDGESRREIERMASDLNLDGSVIFAGTIPHEEIPRWLGIADVAVAPSVGLSEAHGGTGTPQKVFEYMAAAKPIVATNVSQMREVLEDGQDSLLVEPGDGTEMGRAMLRLIRDAEERQRLGRNARQRAVERHSWSRYGESLEKIYARFVSAGNGQRTADK